MVSKSAAVYDALDAHSGKAYAAEADQLRELIRRYGQSEGRAWLDVACGTGVHIAHLQDEFVPTGLDIDERMLAIARERCPSVPFYQGDMVDFSLDRRFDVVTCLFSSIGYARTVDRLRDAVATMARHLASGGLLIVEPWIFPEDWEDRHVGALFVDEPDLKIARINHSHRRDRISILDFQYLIGTPDGVEHATEHHELGLFAHADYVDAFERAELHVEHDPEGLMGRGLYLGIAPLSP